jgi:hypothetical protein
MHRMTIRQRFEFAADAHSLGVCCCKLLAVSGRPHVRRAGDKVTRLEPGAEHRGPNDASSMH